MTRSDRQLIVATILSLVIALPCAVALERAWTTQNQILSDLQN